MPATLEARIADIAALDVDAIVNASNEMLLRGGGVDGAIHRAAGPRLAEACAAFPEVRPGVKLPTGTARLTPGFDLPARFVIHTAGPVWHGGEQGEPTLLAACYTSVLALAREHGCASIAIPAISTGIFAYPLDAAARVAVAATRAALAGDPSGTIRRVLFSCYNEPARAAFQAALDDAGA